jgi:two-component system chemotaxis sensor kinase CheA
MSDPDRLPGLLDALGMEIVSAQADSTQGQFPILDLLGNLRDVATGRPEHAELGACSAEAWSRMVQIVESGRPFLAADIEWLHALLTRIQGLAHAPQAGAIPASTPPVPTPLTTPDPAVDPDSLPIVLNLSDDGDLLREFITESREHLDNIEQGVLVLENQPDDAETLNTVFRAFHSFKGGAGFLNLIPINRLAHVLESLLDLARQRRLSIDASVIELILHGRDVLKQFIDEIDGQLGGSRERQPILIPIADLKAQVASTIDRSTSEPDATSRPPSPLSDASGASVSPAAVEAFSLPASASTATPAPLPPSSPEGAPNPKPDPAASRPAQGNEGSGNKNGDHGAMIKVDTGKLDSLLDLVGEMVIAQSLVGRDLNQLASLDPQSARNVAQLGRITRELQRVSMSLRMVPIRGLFQKMARVIRDVSAKCGKKVQFVTQGEDTELDRSLVEELADPLLHMVRNSMDHGIEAPEARTAAGKSPTGTLTLRSFHQGGNIVVEIEDDGAGLNQERILRKAVERGLTTASAANTEQQIFAFIFAAGFSTAEKVTDLSGRGVGLDVVRRNLERLRGCIDIASTPGRGTRFKLTLPLTLAIIDGLIVRVGDERYVIPTLSIRGLFRPQSDMISRVHGQAEVVNVRGNLVPLLRLREFFGVDVPGTASNEGIVIVVQSGTTQRCLLVDATLHIQEVVIKSLNDIMAAKNRALAGAAILGDGRVGLIMDVNALVQLEGDSLSEAA